MDHSSSNDQVQPRGGAGLPEGDLGPSDILIVGAGASGLWAALHAAAKLRSAGATIGRGEVGRTGNERAGVEDTGVNNHQPRVVLVDSRPTIGAKILMSGGTRCNLTHRKVHPEDYRGASPKRIAQLLRAHPASESYRIFRDELGVHLKDEDGNIFPADDQARSVLNALVAGIERAGAQIIPGRRVVGLERVGVPDLLPDLASGRERTETPKAVSAASWRVLLQDPAGEPAEPMAARRLILATGGCSYPGTGSDGRMWEILRDLGHSVITPVPALSPFHLHGSFHVPLSGISLPARLTLRAGGSALAHATGDLLWTHKGVSGPVALDLSGIWARSRADQPEIPLEVEASFLPEESVERTEADWLSAAAAHPALTIQSHFRALPRRLVQALAERAGVDPAHPLAQTRRETRRALLGLLLRFPLPVQDVAGFKKAEVTSGGIPLTEVDHGLESKILPGIHFAGEMLHVDGRLGGFNFQWAWSSGAVAGISAAARLRGGGSASGQ